MKRIAGTSGPCRLVEGMFPVSVRVPVQPGVLRWACERGRIQPEYLARHFPGFSAWESGTEKPTLK